MAFLIEYSIEKSIRDVLMAFLLAIAVRSPLETF